MTEKNKSIGNFPNLRFPGFEEEWEVKKLGDVAEIKTGSKDTQNKIDNGIYPFFVRSNTVEKINTYSYDGEAILTSGDGVGVGKNFHYLNGKFDFHQRVYSIRNFKEGYDGKYIYNVFSEKFYDRVIRLSAKNSVDSVRMNMISEMKLSFPLLNEQQKIASFLTMIGERIQTQKKIISHLETSILSYRQNIFSQKIRFKDRLGNDFPGWKESKLENICQKKSSNISANKIEDNFGNYIIYGASGILKKVDFYEEENDYISIVKDGAGVGRLFFCKGRTSVLGTMDIIKPKSDVNTYFLFYQLNNLDFTKYATGSTIPHIYFKDYKNEKIKIPCFEEQTKIANFLFSITEKIETEKKILTQYQTQNKYLLTKLFV